MPKYLWKASYTTAGAKGVAAEGGSARVKAVTETAESAGGRVEALYFAFGDVDVYVIVDLPDNEAATAAALTVNSSGAVSLQTTLLITPDEVDAAAKRTVQYRPAGG